MDLFPSTVEVFLQASEVHTPDTTGLVPLLLLLHLPLLLLLLPLLLWLPKPLLWLYHWYQ